MQPVSPALVGDIYVVRHILRTHPQEYVEALAKVQKLTKREKIAACGKEEFIESWDELFAGEVQWYATHLPPSALYVNRIFHELFHTKGSCGKPMEELIEDYQSGVMAASDKHIIDHIRKTLHDNPRIIALTVDEQEYVIFDGWHTAVAFILEEKPIPAFVGIANNFSLFRC
jgi:hypothetical protein